MKLTIFGSCRQDSLSSHFDVTPIKEILSFPHYTKEIIQCIEFCQNASKMPKEMTRYMFRSGILENRELSSSEVAGLFDTTDFFVIEIASRIAYEYKGFYAHHILTEEQYGFHDRSNIVQRNLTNEEIENDILYMRELLGEKPFMIVGHICTRPTGKRKELLELLRWICDKHNIFFFDPMEHLVDQDPETIFISETVLAHYTPYGHEVIGNRYNEFIQWSLQHMDLLPYISILTIYQSEFPKIRMGSKADGGYVIADIDGYDSLFACGIADDITFEVNFIKKHPIPCHMFDGTIDALPDNSYPELIFHKKNIGPTNSQSTTNLHMEILPYENIFLKMDIETFEFRWLLSLSTIQLQRFKQIVMEIHFPFTIPDFTHLDKRISVSKKMKALETLTHTHTLIHLHGNNCCGTTEYDGILVPNVFECTYIRNDIQYRGKINTMPIPSNLDTPNIEGPDIILSTFPFIQHP